MKQVAVVIIAASVALSSCHDMGRDYVQDAVAANDALSCSVLAGLANQREEAKRLHDYGLLHARKYIDAVREGKVPEVDRARAPDPWGVTGPYGQRGPTEKMILGTIQKSAFQRTTDRLDALPDSEEGRVAAAREFVSAKCEAIGR